MTEFMKLDTEDERALHALDPDFAVNADRELASIAGSMKLTIVRAADDGGIRLRLQIQFPNDEKLDVWISRERLLHELGIIGDDDTRGA